MDNPTPRILNLSCHGLGDTLTGLQTSYFFNLKKINHLNLIATRDEIFKVINLLFPDTIQISEKYSHNNAILHSPELQQELLKEYGGDYINYTVPDLLFRNPLSLNLAKLGLSMQIIKKHRLLLHKSLNKENIIYVGLQTSTENYQYKNIKVLLQYLADRLPDYLLYFPKVNKWDKEITYEDLSGLPENVIIEEDPDFERSVDILSRSCYGVFTCNGPSHLAYHFGLPRLILDPQYEKLPWIARWKEDYEECIDINTTPEEVSDLIVTNIRIPQTQLIPRLKVLQKLYTNWGNELIIKY